MFFFLGVVDASKVPERAGAAHEQEDTRPLRVPIGRALEALAAGRAALRRGGDRAAMARAQPLSFARNDPTGSARRHGEAMTIARTALALILLSVTALQAQQFGPAQFPIKADDGTTLTNYALSTDQMAQVAALPGLVDVEREGRRRALSVLRSQLPISAARRRRMSTSSLRSDPKLRLSSGALSGAVGAIHRRRAC